MTDILYADSAIALSPAVKFDRRENIALIYIDNPPVNASSVAVRQGLMAAFDTISADASISGVVIVGAGKSFIAGSDIKEFGKALPPPELPAVLTAIEACHAPVIAAIHGSALGGGYELALACDWRIAVPDAVVGLPEVSLGMIPGAGGTQRLPRLIGIPQAIDIVTSSRRVNGVEAAQLGMVDAIASNDLVADAIAFLSGKPKRLSAQLVAPPASAEAIESATNTALAKGKGRECVTEAIRSVRLVETTPVAEALEIERAIFQRLRTGEEASALRYNFFGERAAAKPPVTATALKPNVVGVVGAGTMGAGIAQVLLTAGLNTVLVDSNAEVTARAIASITKGLSEVEKLGKLNGDTAETRLALLTTSNDLSALAETDLVIEAVFEDLAVKTNVIAKLGQLMRPDAILATNTSYLDIEVLAAASGRTDRFFGLHFFAPVPRMKLLEVVQCAATTDTTLATGFALAKAIGKLPVLARPCEGFIGNRIYAKYRAQCEYALDDGALPKAIDAAATKLGFAMGLFAVSDISGLDIAWRLRQSKAATRDPQTRYVTLPDALCELGRLGRKTNAGWYDYDDNGKPVPSPIVSALVTANAAQRNTTAPDANAISAAILGAIVNEAALIFAEGISRSASDIDVVLTNGYGFSKNKGGPLFQASRMSQAQVEAMVDLAAANTGFGFVRGDTAALLSSIRQS
ncbi:enoyl-CoA hydratase/isomerase family protein [Devosia sp. MC532]|uniref:3-hydroxyacyl-CoA dehydrogenase NAD-binding domain-containing protein n=1 Tax=Devosia sp. MC532 TaxID=2799788 RepID=UPI0018F61396|nr:3-hydroxyacyl-CoA dehydrogenase NAD-binding domain-containing protein [Devosia sp. MC532]MBJ7577844.1 enoyl-CoA hydratase/isomerase family protein [Devosia sp. MC532]